MKKQDKVLLIRVSQAMVERLREERVITGVATSEFVRRAINQALYGDQVQNSRTQATAARPAFILTTGRTA